MQDTNPSMNRSDLSFDRLQYTVSNQGSACVYTTAYLSKPRLFGTQDRHRWFQPASSLRKMSQRVKKGDIVNRLLIKSARLRMSTVGSCSCNRGLYTSSS